MGYDLQEDQRHILRQIAEHGEEYAFAEIRRNMKTLSNK